jgi:hypothetical protein
MPQNIALYHQTEKGMVAIVEILSSQEGKAQVKLLLIVFRGKSFGHHEGDLLDVEDHELFLISVGDRLAAYGQMLLDFSKTLPMTEPRTEKVIASFHGRIWKWFYSAVGVHPTGVIIIIRKLSDVQKSWDITPQVSIVWQPVKMKWRVLFFRIRGDSAEFANIDQALKYACQQIEQELPCDIPVTLIRSKSIPMAPINLSLSDEEKIECMRNPKYLATLVNLYIESQVP